MADGETGTQAADAPWLAGRGERIVRRSLLAALAVIPALAGLYGLHRDGGEGAAVGVVSAIFATALFMLPAAKLLNWLTSPRKPPLWRFEGLYWWLTGLAAAATLMAVTILIGAFDPAEEHGLDGFVDGFIAGILSAGLVGFLLARLHAWLMWLKGPAPADESGERSRLQGELAPTLAELEAVRQDVGRRIRRRAAWMTPAGAAAGLAVWGVYILATRQLDLLLPPIALVIGAAAGHIVASRQLAGDYERLYKARVLPRLVALAGALTFQRPPPPDLERLRRFHVFRHFDSAQAEDAIVGRYRGLKISIEQLRLTRGWGPARKRVFRGLLIEIELNNRLTGTTAVAADAGVFGNLLSELATGAIHRVGLESAAFEREYEVYATDQVMARALLTPDFIERFRALERSPGFGRPLALAEDNLLLLAMPRLEDRSGAGDYFAPPSFESPADDNDVLQRLHDDLKSVLRAADSAIALDAGTSAQANRRRRSRAAPAPPG
jgi:hypothetical protein